MDIGKKLRELRKQNDLTLEDLASRSELTKGFLSQVERNLTAPSIATLEDILEALGSNLSEFFHEEEEKQIVFGADDFFSLKEWNYLHNEDPKESEKISYSWQYENLYVMEWALGLIDGPLDFPDHFCAVAEAAQLLTAFHSMREILEAAKPRSAKELLDACDMIFCLDWACTDTRMRDLPAPAGMDGGVVFERHKALNWLVGAGEKADWDHVPVDT